MRATTLFLIIASTVGVANVVPWGGTLTRAAITIDMDPAALWKMYIPVQVFGLFLTLISAIVLGRLEMRRGAGLREGDDQGLEHAKASPEVVALRRPKLVPVNLAMTLVMVGILIWGKIPTQVVFMAFLALALMINYRSVDEKKARIAAHAANVHPIIVMLLACGVFLGVISKTGMIEAMTMTIIGIIPESLANYIPFLAGIFGTPVAMAFGPDPYYYGILPIVAEITKLHGLPVTAVAISMSIAQNIVCAISPAVPPAYLLYGLSGVELKDGIKSSFLWLWVLGIIRVVFGTIIGIIVI
jgi:CitMHS family citrate-Mg2+:H+ or citrate-Ca2+:H+ symporter